MSSTWSMDGKDSQLQLYQASAQYLLNCLIYRHFCVFQSYLAVADMLNWIGFRRYLASNDYFLNNNNIKIL